MKKTGTIFAISLFFSLVFIFLFNLGMQWELLAFSDEHQHIAGGALLAQKGLLPYKDYAYFHMPNLVLIYGLIFKFTDHLLLAARTFTVICAGLILTLIFRYGWKLFRSSREVPRFLMAAGAVLLLFLHPTFTFTSARTWNQTLPTLFVLLAFVVFNYGLEQQGKLTRWTFLSGLLISLAVGCRITFALAAVPFLGAFFLSPEIQRRESKTSLLLSFGLGALVGILPALILFLLAPKQFLFGNFAQPYLNLLYHHFSNAEGLGPRNFLTTEEKLYFLWRSLTKKPQSFAGFVSFIAFLFLLRGSLRGGKSAKYRFELIFLTGLMVVLWINGYLPSPTWRQYYFPPLPFLVIAILYGVASLQEQNKNVKWYLGLFLVLLANLAVFEFPTYLERIDRLFSPPRWRTMIVHQMGVWIKNKVGEGKVLTFGPIYPLEGGANIYEEFAVGLTAWKLGKFVTGEQAREYRLVRWSTVDDFLKERPPGGILVGLRLRGREWTEESFLLYAIENHYRPLKLGGKKMLWVAPDTTEGARSRK